MGTLGKILLLINLLAAAGVAYVASLDYAARQNLQANAFRHQLMLSGLPVTAPAGAEPSGDQVSLGTVTPGLNRVEYASKKLLADHFAGVNGDDVGGSGPPATQVGEVKAVKAKIDAKLGGSDAEVLAILAGKYVAGRNTITFVPGLLASLAESTIEREAVRSLVDPAALERNPNAVVENAKQARAMLDRKFAAVEKVDPALADAESASLKEKTDALKVAADEASAKFTRADAAAKAAVADPSARPAADAALAEAEAANQALELARAGLNTALADLGTPASRDEGDRQRRVAHLLIHAGESAGWQKRVALVVGLRAYSDAINAQATRLSRMAVSVEQGIALDQARFSEEYATILGLAKGRAELLARQSQVRADKAVQRQKDDEAVTQRRLLLTAKQDELKRIQAEVDAALAAQTTTEAKLFETLTRVGGAFDSNRVAEAALAAAEAKVR